MQDPFWVPFWDPAEPPKSTEIAAKAKIDEKTRKISKIDQKVSCVFSFLGPKMDPKWTKNRPGAEKVRPEAAPEAIFIVFCCRRCSKSLPEPTFGGSDPSKLCSHHNGSTILTKSPFSKKHRKSSLRGPVLGPKMAKKRRRGHPKSPKMAKKVNF